VLGQSIIIIIVHRANTHIGTRDTSVAAPSSGRSDENIAKFCHHL